MLRQIWQSLKRFFQSILALFTPKTKNSGRLNQPGSSVDSLPPLSDTDYEFLFTQLLEGVHNGWHQKRVLKFFAELEDRTNQGGWIAWLKGFGDKVIASPAPNQELAIRMVRFGRLTEFLPSIRRLGQESYKIGQTLLHRQQPQQIWEYTEAPEKPSTEPPSPTKSETKPQPLTPDQLLALIYEDENVAKSIAQELGLEGSSPEQLVDALVNQMIQLQSKIATATPDPNSAVTWLQRAMEQINKGDLNEAIAAYDRALELEPEIAPAWYNRGSLLGNLGKLPEALTSFQKVVEINPEDSVAWNDIGNTLYKLQRWEEALEAWDKAIAIKSDYYQAWYNRACALEHLHRTPEAKTSYQQALNINPDFYQAATRLKQLEQS